MAWWENAGLAQANRYERRRYLKQLGKGWHVADAAPPSGQQEPLGHQYAPGEVVADLFSFVWSWQQAISRPVGVKYLPKGVIEYVLDLVGERSTAAPYALVGIHEDVPMIVLPAGVGRVIEVWRSAITLASTHISGRGMTDSVCIGISCRTWSRIFLRCGIVSFLGKP